MNYKTAATTLRIIIKLDTRPVSGICVLIRSLKYHGIVTPAIASAMDQEMHHEIRRRQWHSGYGGHPISYPVNPPSRPDWSDAAVWAFGTPDVHNWDPSTEYGKRRLAIAYHLADWLDNGGKNEQ